MEKINKIAIVLGCLLILFSTSMIASATWDYNYDEWEDEAAWGGLALLGGAFCAFGVIWFIIAILIAIWVYKDAEKRGSSGALWLIIVLLTGIIGIIIWLVIRPPIGGKKDSNVDTADRRCPNCGRAIPFDAHVCPYCGKNFSLTDASATNK